MIPLDQIDRELHEKFFGCWHEWDWQPLYGKPKYICIKCHLRRDEVVPKPSCTRNGGDYMKLLEKVKEDSWWEDFKMSYVDNHETQDELDAMLDFVDIVINPERGSRAIHEFFVGGEK